MAAPTYAAGTPGNVISSLPLAAGGSKNAAALVDLSTVLGGALHCKMTTGGTPPTAATTFSCYRVYGATSAGNTTLSAGAAVGSTSLSVGSSAGISAGQKVALLTAAGLIGEVITVSSVAGTTLTLVAGTIDAYSAGDLVFLIEQTASGGTITPGSSWAANASYSTSIYPPAAWVWVVQAVNADTAQPVTVSVTVDRNPSFQ